MRPILKKNPIKNIENKKIKLIVLFIRRQIKKLFNKLTKAHSLLPNITVNCIKKKISKTELKNETQY